MAKKLKEHLIKRHKQALLDGRDLSELPVLKKPKGEKRKRGEDLKLFVSVLVLPSLINGRDTRSVYGEFYRTSSVNVMAKLALYELGIKSDISIVTIHNYDPITGEPIDEHDKRYKRLPEDQNVLKIDMAKMNIKETYDYSGLHYFNY